MIPETPTIRRSQILAIRTERRPLFLMSWNTFYSPALAIKDLLAGGLLLSSWGWSAFFQSAVSPNGLEDFFLGDSGAP
jgi:hypothetical protein